MSLDVPDMNYSCGRKWYARLFVAVVFLLAGRP